MEIKKITSIFYGNLWPRSKFKKREKFWNKTYKITRNILKNGYDWAQAVKQSFCQISYFKRY